jgi:histidyl-tRNA synthetase
MPDKSIKAERPGGFLDFLPAEFLARESMMRTIERVFRSFGFNPLETPMVEFRKTLAGEQSDTGKNIFHLQSGEGDEPISLRFDQTVPFARLLAANPFDARSGQGIRLPFKRMALGPVFRAESPQAGRYRQFYQIDADIAGTSSMTADAEIIILMAETMRALAVGDFRISINNRKLLNGLADVLRFDDDEGSRKNQLKELMRSLDKYDKIGRAGVGSEISAKFGDSLSGEIERVLDFVEMQGNNSEKLAKCQSIFAQSAVAQEGLSELSNLLSLLSAVPEAAARVSLNFSIARGLDYYTGTVMETVLPEAPQFGSVFSGGRYNDLVSRFTSRDLPAVGASIGVDRLFAALSHLGLLDTSRRSVADFLVLRLSKERDADYLRLLAVLRQSGCNADICLLDDTTFKSQFNFALQSGVRYALICGEDEFVRGTVQIKDLLNRTQEEIATENLAETAADLASLISSQGRKSSS